MLTSAYLFLTFFHSILAAISLTQTHPAAPYVCRTGNITLRCQYGITEGVLWTVGSMFDFENTSIIPGHTALPLTTTHQDLVVVSYTNLRERYQCTAVIGNGTRAGSNYYLPIVESKK